jgi:hypothetical protein
MKKPVDFINRFRLTEVSIIEKQEYVSPGYNLRYDYFKNDHEPIYIQQERRPYIKCEIPQPKFEELVEITDEWFELLQDPECARLLMEARFINRLKRGK